MRRGEFTEKERELIKSIEIEFELFKYKTLSKSRFDIYDSCNVICFYHCIYEYFLYAENIRAEHITACMKEDNVIARLYELYLKYEYLRYNTYSDVEELLSSLVYNT